MVAVQEEIVVGEQKESTVHIEKLHSQSKGYITLANKANGYFKQWHYKYNQLIEGEEALLIGDDIYISQNTFYTTYRRTEYLKELRNLYIDIDFKSLGRFKELEHWQIIKLLEMDCFDSSIPEPSIILNSGNGIHLVWNIETVQANSSKVVALWYAIERYIHDKLKDYGSDSNCLDVCRVLRVADTRNSKSNTVCSIIRKNERVYTLREIQEEYLPDLAEKKATRGRPKKVVSLYNEHMLHHARVKDLIKICELRDWNMTGLREFVLFLYRYWTCNFTQDIEQALSQTLEVNSMFTYPLSEREVITSTRSAERVFKSKNKEYRYKNTTLIEKLEITEYEQRHLKTIIDASEKKRRKNERERQERRNENGLTKREQQKQDTIEQVIELKKEGLKQMEIAKRLGVTQQYVSKILRANKN